MKDSKWPKEISLKTQNRDGMDLKLIRIGKGPDYKLSNSDFVRFGQDHIGNMVFIDPPGGPFMSPGYSPAPGFEITFIIWENNDFTISLMQQD